VEEWQKNVELNLSSAFYAVRAVIPHMIRAGCGRIVLVGSSAVYNGGGGAIDYAAAKAGLNGMMMYLAKEYARKGILTNMIHPAVINTDLLRERYDTEEKKAALRSQIPAGRLGEPEDIAAMTAYLASKWGDYICGQSILIDGGRTFFR
jgi:3-oxoacyl-[acyl-carrier protein] reductase